jgi:LmbE family N-acetylglucosaminyl deacetylase
MPSLTSNELRLPKAAVIVAHPDDEVLWAGGFMLEHSNWDWFVASLCRASDPDRAPKFAHGLECLPAHGKMADMDDGPEQEPLSLPEVRQQILSMLPQTQFDLILTHGPEGEYTWHRRHVEVCQAVLGLWREGRLASDALWLFAYEDGNRQYLPRPQLGAHYCCTLSPEHWQAKYDWVTRLYGFEPDSWEARATPRQEAFWCFNSPAALERWLASRKFRQ